MNFEKDLRHMRDSYFELERQFIEISRIIPLDNPSDTYSPRLYDILQTSCVQVENLLRLICDKLELESGQNSHFLDYYNLLNKTKILELQVVVYFSGTQALTPFQLEGKDPPFWWTAYNKTKHNLPVGYKQGNLKNTMNALAGGYALHCMATYSLSAGSKILENNEWMEESSITLNTMSSTIEVHWNDEDVRPRSMIFYPLSYFRPLGGL